MSGEGTLGSQRGGEASNLRARRRTLLAAGGALALVMFSAVAQADDGDPVRDEARLGAIATSSTPADVATDTGDPISAASPLPPTGDAELDALAQACQTGDLMACDMLFLQAPTESEYEEYGDTCGGRQDAGTEEYCALESGEDQGTSPAEPVEPTPPGQLGADPELDALASECYAGDMDACDELYDSSESASDYQVYGDTCAGRQPEDTGQYCRDLENPVPGTGPVGSTPDGSTPDDTGTDDTGTDDTGTDDTTPDDTGTDDTGTDDTGTDDTTPDDTSTDDTSTDDTSTDDTSTDDSDPAGPGTIPEPTLEPVGLGTDAELDALAAECYGGDMEACDELYDQSDPGTPYRQYGDTCAGRQAEDTGVWCRAAFGGESPPTTDSSGPDTATPDTATPDTATPDTVTPPTTTPDTATPETTTPETTTSDTVAPATVPPTTTPDTVAVPTAPPATATSVPTIPVATLPAPTVPVATLPVPTAPGVPTIPVPTVPGVPAVPVPTAPGVPTVPVPSAPGLPTVPGETTVPGATVPTGVIPPPTLQPVGLGTNAELDALAQACFAGDMASCDELFRASDTETDVAYHDYGDTCAGRQPLGTGRWCEAAFPAAGTITVPGATVPGPTVPGATTPGATTPGVTTPVTQSGVIPPPTQLPTGLGTDPALDALAQSCYDGSMQACDDLFVQSAIGSPYHVFADTCAGRQTSGTYKFCVAAFPSAPGM